MPFAWLIDLVAATSRSVAPTAGQVNWISIVGVLLGIVVSVWVIVTGIKTAVTNMMTKTATGLDEALIAKCIDPLTRELYEIKGELRSLTR